MAKTFWEILAESDDEYTYYIHSVANIHHAELFERVKIALMPYEIKSLECDSYKPYSKDNKQFPDQMNQPTYTIKAVTRYPLTKGFASALAMETHIHISHLKIDPDKTLDPVNEPEEVSSKEAQSLVGTKRIAEFIKELQQDRKDREGMTTKREVYESFYTTHLGLEKVVSKPLRKGYYLVETYRENDTNFLRAEGPFDSRPTENLYHDRIRTTNAQVVTETSAGGIYGVKVQLDAFELK